MADDLEATQTFHYSPTQDERHIRLVTVYPGVGEEIKCSLRPCCLDEPERPVYVALSYVWGDPDLVEAITCDNATLRVTKNLKTALRYLRHTTETRVFWIDAICINQKDIVERNSHVQSMKEIYSSAQEVLIWLGVESADSSMAFEMMDLLARSSCEDKHLFPSSDEGRPLWNAFASLCARPWFRRVWVRQEVAVAGKATIMCGTQTTEWETLVDAFREIRALGLDRYEADLRPCDAGFGIIGLRKRFQSDRGIELEDLLWTDELESSDPRDKVYALVGLVVTPAARAAKFEVEYSKPVSEVFTNLARFAIAAYKSVQVLGHVREGSADAPRLTDLPSWVPDRTYPSSGPVLYGPGRHYEDFCAAGATEAVFRNIVNEPKGIAVKGYAVDTVTWLGGLLKSPPPLFSKDQAKCAVLRNWEDIAAQQAPYVTGEAISEAYTWTLVADANMPEQGSYMYGCWASSVIGAEPSSYRKDDDPASESSPNTLSEELEEACRKVKADPEAVRLRDQGPRKINQDWGSYSMRYLIGMMDAAFDRRLFATGNKYIGLAPAGTKVGDLVCVLLGGNTPFLLRPSEEYSDRYRLVGECYVHGIMHGEVLRRDGLDMQEFILR